MPEKTKKLKLGNAKMLEMMESLRPLLSHRDKIGYFAARNTRILGDSLTEYISIRKQTICKYGTENKGEFTLKIGSPEWEKFCSDMAEFDSIEHEISVYICSYADAIGSLTGEEILAADWMLED